MDNVEKMIINTKTFIIIYSIDNDVTITISWYFSILSFSYYQFGLFSINTHVYISLCNKIIFSLCGLNFVKLMVSDHISYKSSLIGR